MEKKAWTVPDLLQLTGGYWTVSALHAGVKLDVFTPLSARAASAEELAGVLKADRRGLEMLLNALAAMELLEKNGPEFSATSFAAEFLSRSSEKYLGYIVMHHHYLSASWIHLDEGVEKGGPVRDRVSHGEDESARESFEMGMFNLAMQIAPVIVDRIDLFGRRRFLDLGGGPGTYAVHFCLNNPGLSAVVYDLPTTRTFAEKTIARFGLSDRVSFHGGDFTAEGIEGKFDVAWLSHILHGEGPRGCATILEKAVKSLEPGGMILVQEFILNDTHDGPLFPALFSLNMLLGTPEGQAYSEGEIKGMLAAAGVEEIRRLPIDLPNGAGVMAGIRPG